MISNNNYHDPDALHLRMARSGGEAEETIYGGAAAAAVGVVVGVGVGVVVVGVGVARPRRPSTAVQ